MNCLVCRGACCEELIVTPNAGDGDGLGFPGALRQFLTVRSTAELPGPSYVIASRCPQLTPEGLCACHAADDFPFVCALFAAGGEECRAALARRRTPEQIALIMEEPTCPEL